MAGGLLNIISVGNANVILTGNPTKTFFKATYSKYTNFGLQRFRLDYEGSRDLRLSTSSQYTFKIKRYGDLLMDSYLVINLPDIWSPIYNPTIDNYYEWAPYGFRWIKDIGTKIISMIEINCGTTLLQRYTGDYIASMVERDFTAEKKDLFNRMSGNIPELHDPANAFGRSNAYPNAFYTNKTVPGTQTVMSAEPSIRGRTLYIPINAWFTLDSRCAFPLISLQYNELTITVTLRPIQEMFQIRDVMDYTNKFPYIQPDFTNESHRMYRFLQTPPDVRIDTKLQSTNEKPYQNVTENWNADVHMITTYGFLSAEESKLFAAEDQIYLVKDIFQYSYPNVTGTSRIKLENSMGMVANWMWYLQRSDVNMRNEWSNYTNWPYSTLPGNVVSAPDAIPVPSEYQDLADFNSLYSDVRINGIENPYYDINMVLEHGPARNPNEAFNTGFMITGEFNSDNHKDILLSMGILFEGEYRENIFPRGLYDYVEKYVRTHGSAKEGLYCYNYCLNTNPFDYQPSGAINLSKFKNIELELSTYVPPVNPYRHLISESLCGDSGAVMAVSSKQSWRLFDYNFDMILFEERYNILSFIGGNCAMMYAR